MLTKLILTALLASHIFVPATPETSGQILGIKIQEAGDKITLSEPQKIINKNLGVKISAKHAIVIDKASGKILFAKNAQETQPIASITKLMTALVFLDTNPNLDQKVTIKLEDLIGAGKANLNLDETVTLENLLNLSLIASDNSATLALVRTASLTRNDFVAKMNTKAKGLGLKNTQFSGPTGLSSGNVSTPTEITTILNLALHHTLLKQILPQKSYHFVSISNNYHEVKSTDKLLNSYLEVLGGKTGFIEESGYCFAGAIKLANGQEVFSVVLGSRKQDDRFQDTKALISWIEDNYQW